MDKVILNEVMRQVINMPYNVSHKNILKKLNIANETGRFKKYPDFLLGKTCLVKVNGDDYLRQDEFMIKADFPILPRSIIVYGKKHRPSEDDTDNIYLNYWLEVFIKTIECGKMTNRLFKKSSSKNELTIGLPLTFRMNAFNGYSWNKENIIKFLSCLFGIEIQESYFHQQIFLDYDLAA